MGVGEGAGGGTYLVVCMPFSYNANNKLSLFCKEVNFHWKEVVSFKGRQTKFDRVAALESVLFPLTTSYELL